MRLAFSKTGSRNELAYFYQGSRCPYYEQRPNGESEGDHVSLVAKEGCSSGCSVE